MNEVSDAWNDAVEVGRPGEQLAKALAFGREFRVDVPKLLNAIYRLVDFYAKTATPLAVTDPIQFLKLGGDAFAALQATASALVQQLSELQFMSCVFVQSLRGVPASSFAVALHSFLDLYGERDFPWYLGVTPERIAEARRTLSTLVANGLGGEALIWAIFNNKNTSGLLAIDDGVVKLNPRTVTWSGAKIV
jgi:hypothetical protein